MSLIESLCNFKIGSEQFVYVTHVNNPHSFYVRTASIEDETIISLEKPGRPLLITQDVHLGKIVIYRSATLEKYVRGNIRYISKKSNNAVYDIFALDYGCYDKSVEVKFIHEVMNKTEIQKNFPPLATHCLLDFCQPIEEEFTQEVIDTMKFFVGEHRTKIIIRGKTNDKLRVVLKTVDCPGDVATMLALLHITTLTNCENSINRFYSSCTSSLQLTKVMKYKQKELNVDDTLHVRVQSGKSLSSFYVAEVNDFKKYTKEHEDFTFYCKNRPILDTFVPGVSCGVNVSNFVKYERAIIKEITVPNEKALVHLVDWGKDTEVDFTNIKSVVSEKYFVEPAIAILCSTDASQTWKNGLPVFLYQGYDFLIRITEVGDGINIPHKVNLYKI